MKIFEGIVISIGMNKTAIVEVSRRTPHPLYKKLIKRSKKYKADSAGFTPVIGNLVKIIETRPISKDKYFKILIISGVKQLKKIIEPTEELDNSVKVNPARSSRSPSSTVRKAANPTSPRLRGAKKESK